MSWLEKLIRSKVFVITLIVLPGLWPAWPIFVTHDSTVLADPLKFILHHQGFTTCILLATVLTFTPLRVIFPKSKLVQALNRHRRLVGVSAFCYAALHFTVHIQYEGGFGVIKATLATAVTKPFLISGLLAFSILLVLAATSLNVAIRWLGGKRWKNLHRLAYVAAGLAAYHQIYARKIFPMQVVWIFGPVLVLQILRIGRQRLKRRPVAHAAA